ncbi:DoxX family membrane protein [Paracidobacterium acidisoli]|uniref:DoxX family membrane protein n=1 Tax=Paracidobacterium acidisoli TaxID=2303751 RepID=A0A372IKW0_9BACT|nr:DoxX family membrane protein [Paracidobacterium acidisoli]MBT9332651.1 DoxX family membrane protein [Paracidobacterium acidisoli]
MTRSQQPALTLFAIGLIGLGILAFIYGDFALVWQPVAAWVPGRTALAYASGVVMLLGGIGLLFEATAAISVRILFLYLILWTLLKVPVLFVTPQIEDVWLGVGELTVLLSGGWILFARLARLREGSLLSFAAGESGVRIARIVFALSLIPIGLSHLIYTQQTADYVPAWFHFRVGFARLTGIGQMACGLGVLFSILPRIAACTEAVMLSLFTLLVWLPAILAAPGTRLPWTAFFISWIITAAAWVVAGNIGVKHPAGPGA